MRVLKLTPQVAEIVHDALDNYRDWLTTAIRAEGGEAADSEDVETWQARRDSVDAILEELEQ